VFVVGSVNVDLVVTLARLPQAGETVSGGRFAQHDGGKGGNQAVAAARLGAETAFVGAVGDDAFGEQALGGLRGAGVDVGAVEVRPGEATGVALILVEAGGENVIAVAPGANAGVTAALVTKALEAAMLGPGDVVLASHEIPTAALRAALAAGRRAGATTILNPAPADGLDRGVFGLADIVTPNRTELTILARAEARRTGRPDPGGDGPERQARLLLGASSEGAGPRLAIVVTLGSAGAIVVPAGGGPMVEVAAPRVVAVDATGAGDAFAGAMAAAVAEGRDLVTAVRRAVVAGSLATTTVGARDGMPSAKELEAALETALGTALASDVRPGPSAS
jgi:ribokinase